MAGEDPDCRRKNRARAARRRALGFNLRLLAILTAGAAVWIQREPIARFLAEHGDTAGLTAEILRGADPDALSAEPIFALRGRVEEMLERCFAIHADSRPLRAEHLPAILALRVEGRARPAFEYDFAALKSRGLSDWTLMREGQGLDPRLRPGLEALGKLAVFSPGAPCPPGSQGKGQGKG